MKFLADLHISPVTVAFLNVHGFKAFRINEVLPANSSDEKIVLFAREKGFSIISQDIDFSSIIALSGERAPSLVTLRLKSSAIDLVNDVLRKSLPIVAPSLEEGAIVVVSERTIRIRSLPLK